MTRDLNALVNQIAALLPQTQCRQCGYPGCQPYAKALAAGRASINQCPPGGDEGARELAALLGVAWQPLDPRCGAPKPPSIAVIDEAQCIGCTLCIQACPVDAIVGARELMHTIVARDCTGCELCMPPCPVDCIKMVETGALPTRAQRRIAAAAARARYERRTRRRASLQRAGRTGNNTTTDGVNPRIISRAMERARRRIAHRGPSSK